MTRTRSKAAFVDFARMCVQEYGARIAYCDSAETAMVQGLRNAIVREHIPLVSENARKGAINDRIRFLCRMMAAGKVSRQWTVATHHRSA